MQSLRECVVAPVIGVMIGFIIGLMIVFLASLV